nr:MAG TPA: hypothetical protein [Caudoviricetes sp.]DAK00055.1 MAG TPA: hypothetical protein [Bacteriophage sp.]DAM51336.1 MAG TPA: hypothetical protein [Caudoviricetes sp.]DAV64643.1 MAG TPA: hypothetical protein [Caudoviricetes sp.]
MRSCAIFFNRNCLKKMKKEMFSIEKPNGERCR